MSNQENWETQEVINHLINDESAYEATKNKSAGWIRKYVGAYHLAPADLYASFQREKAHLKDVDWAAVEEACKE
jgi:hypothetical protein